MPTRETLAQWLEQHLLEGLEQGLYSAVQCVVSDASGVLLSLAQGQTRDPKRNSLYLDKPQPIDEHSLFDVASLTKALSTSALVMCAVAEGRLQLDQKLIKLSGIELAPHLLALNLADLLCHRSKFEAWRDFRAPDRQAETRQNARQRILSECYHASPRKDPAEACYSDLGYLVIGFILEEIYDMPQDQLFLDKIAKPLGLETSMMYCPLHQVDGRRIVSTKWHEAYALSGHPDDDNCRVLSHVAGHAGLFASGLAIASYLDKLLSADFVCSPELVASFLRYKTAGSHYALGWDRPNGQNSLSGRHESEPVIGHLGYTGCSMWLDLDRRTSVVLLTNRSHMNDETSSIADFRRAVHKTAWALAQT